MPSLAAFLTAVSPIVLNTPGRQAHAICARRCAPAHGHLVLSATTADEPKAEPLSPLPPPQRPVPRQPPARQPPNPSPPRSFQSSPGGQQRPDRPRKDRDSRPDRSRSDNRSRSADRSEYRPRPRQDREDRPAPPTFVPEPGAIYYTKCSHCSAVYEIDPVALGRGQKVECSVCSNQWFQKPDRLTKLNEKESFKPYPLEQKDELIRAQSQQRRDRQRSFRDGGNKNYGEKRDNGPRRNNYKAGNTAHSVFIGNLPFTVSEEELEALISSKVQLRRLSIVTDSATGRSKGFGFADVATEDEVHLLVKALDGYELNGRNISVRVGRKN